MYPERIIAELWAHLEWIKEALAGNEVPDFAQSFTWVRVASELRRRVDKLEKENEALHAQLQAARSKEPQG